MHTNDINLMCPKFCQAVKYWTGKVCFLYTFRALALKRKNDAEREEKRRQQILAKRREKQKEATERFQRAHMPPRPSSGTSSKLTLCLLAPLFSTRLHSQIPNRSSSGILGTEPDYFPKRRPLL